IRGSINASKRQNASLNGFHNSIMRLSTPRCEGRTRPFRANHAPKWIRSGGWLIGPPGTSPEQFLRLLNAAEYLVWIVPCLEGGTPTRTSGSSIYPAVQNMLLAARALGLGATVTTLYLQFDTEAEAALGLPPNVHSYALLPIGYPMGRFGPVRRV